MKRKLLFLLTMVLLTIPVLSFAQGWSEVTDPDNWGYIGVLDSTAGSEPHGVAVDPEGKIWICYYSTGATVNEIRVYNSDGTPASFSPITEVTASGDLGDSTFTTMRSARGITTDNNGNIIVTVYGTDVLRINYQTGAGMNYFIKDGSTLSPAVDGDGFIYIGKVVGVNPITVLNSDFTSSGEITLDGAPGFARGMDVSADGKAIWTGTLSTGPLKRWETTDYINWTPSDTIMTNADGDTIWQAQLVTVDYGPEGNLWVSQDAAYGGDQTINAAIAMNYDAKTYYEVSMPDTTLFSLQGPRGVAFSTTGDTMYVASFNANAVFMYKKGAGGTNIGNEVANLIPEGYSLQQNYPNPFNPTTVIPFELGKDGHVMLSVYNIKGQKVATLVNRHMTAGAHQIKFDGSDFASGLYMVRLQSENGKVDLAREMLLTK